MEEALGHYEGTKSKVSQINPPDVTGHIALSPKAQTGWRRGPFDERVTCLKNWSWKRVKQSLEVAMGTQAS